MPTPSSEEGDEHRVLAADVVRDPAEERPAHAVEHPVDRQGEGQRRQRQAEDRDRHAGDLEVVGDRRELRDRHQAAGADHDEHRRTSPRTPAS